MAIEDILSRLPKVFGTTPEVYRGLLDAPERASLENRANIGGLLGFASALAQGMSPQGYSRSPLQNVLTALGAGYGAAGQTYDAGLNQVSNVMKLAQAKRQLTGLAAMKAANPDLAYLADVSPEEFVKQVSARERMKMYGLGTTPSQVAPALVPAPAPVSAPAPAPTVEAPAGLMSPEVGSGGFVGGGYGSADMAAPPVVRGIFSQSAPAPFVTTPATTAASSAPAAVAPAPAAAPSAVAPMPASFVSPENQAEAARLRSLAVLAKQQGDEGVAEEFRRKAEELDPKEEYFVRDGALVSNKRGKLIQFQKVRILPKEEAENRGFPVSKGQQWQEDFSGKISKIEGTETAELDKKELINTLRGQFVNVYPTLQPRVNALISRAGTLTKDQINSEVQNILNDDSKILADLDPRLQAAELARRKASKTDVNVYPAGAAPLGKEGANKVDAQLLELGQNRLNLQSISQNFKSKYLQKPFQLKMAAIAELEKYGKRPTPEQAAELAEYAEFAQNSYNQLNAYINFITGAAVGSGEEEARIRKGVPDPQKDSPTQFLSKLDAKIREGRLYEARLGYIKQNGLKMTDVDVNKIPTLMRQREAALKGDNKLFGGKSFSDQDPNHKAIVRAILSREFGLME
jgi:hypothetical protein